MATTMPVMGLTEIPLNDYYGNSYIGVVDSIAVIGENQNGVTVYPAVLRVDNPMGTLMGGDVQKAQHVHQGGLARA